MQFVVGGRWKLPFYWILAWLAMHCCSLCNGSVGGRTEENCRTVPASWMVQWLPSSVSGCPNGRYHAPVIVWLISVVPRPILIVLAIVVSGWSSLLGWWWQCKLISPVWDDSLPDFLLGSWRVAVSLFASNAFQCLEFEGHEYGW